MGVLFALVASALADRMGSRRLILGSLAVAAVANGVAAAAPSFEVFTASQVVARAALQCTAVVASVAAVEEAPEGARAYSLSMFGARARAGLRGLGAPAPARRPRRRRLADRVRASAPSRCSLLPSLRRTLRETDRYRTLADRTSEHRGRVAEVFDRRYGRRFLLLGAVAFLTNVFAAPSSQLDQPVPHRRRTTSRTPRSRCSAA